MAFADEIVKDGRGLAIRLDVSLDNWTTVNYRYGTHGGKLDGTNYYDARVAKIGTLNRGLGQGGIAAAATLDVVLDNTDELADWLMDRATADALKARFRLYLVVYDTAVPDLSANSATKQLGEFVAMDFPRRDEANIKLTLADDVLGFLGEQFVTPSLRDWAADAGSTTANCPMKETAGNTFVFQYSLDENTQAPLAFGSNPIPAIPIGGPPEAFSDAAALTRGLLVCCTTDSAAPGANTISQLWIESEAPLTTTGLYRQVFRHIWAVPKTNSAGSTIWSAKKSQALTVDGKTFYVLYVEVGIQLLYDFFNFGVSTGGTAGEEVAPPYAIWHDFFNTLNFAVLGDSYSERNGSHHAAMVIRDLVTHYAKDGSLDRLNQAAFLTVKNQYYAPVSGVIWPSRDNASMRDHISAICASSGLDIFGDMGGSISCTVAGLHDYASQTATLLAISEERIADVEEWIPSQGERGAPYNRIKYTNAKDSPFYPAAISTGPFDDPGGTVTTWRRILVREMDESWSDLALTSKNPWASRDHVEAKIRPRLRFTTTLEALQLELGDYFQLSWTRNLGASDPYSNAIFQLEGMSIDLTEMRVELEALWRDDLRSDKPYLLDDENFLVRVSAAGGRTCNVADSSSAVAFSSGSLIADGVAAGDILVLKDSTLAADNYTRFRALRILSRDSASQLTVTDGDLDFDAPSGVNVSDWTIYRGHTTYHTAASDPTNYPDGGGMYGRCANTSTGTYSDATTPHRLLLG